MTDEQQPAPRASVAKARSTATGPKAQPADVVLRYVGDGSVFQSNVPNRDVTVADNLSGELAELAVATGTHKRV